MKRSHITLGFYCISEEELSDAVLIQVHLSIHSFFDSLIHTLISVLYAKDRARMTLRTTAQYNCL